MIRRLLPCVALLGLVALPAAVRAADDKKADTPAVVIRVQSLDDLLGNFHYLAGMVGREEQAKQLEGIFKAKAGGPKGLEGIDAKRPIAVYAMFREGGIENTVVVGLVPIADEKAFLGLIENVGAKAEKGDDGVYQITSPNLMETTPVFLRFAHKHAYITALHKDAIAKDKLLASSAVLPAGRIPMLSVTLRIDQIPQNIRDLAADQLQTQIANAKDEKKDDETPAQHAAKGEILDLVQRHITSVIKEGGEAAVRIDVDQKAKELSVEVGLSGKDGTALAKNIAALGKQRSVVAGLVGADSIMNGLVNFPIDEKVAAALTALAKDALKQDIAKQTDAAKKAQAERLFKAIEPALKLTDFDWAVDFRGPRANGLYTLVGGQKVADGAKLDKAIRDVAKDFPIKLDVEKAGDVAIHSIIIPDADENFKKSFGDGPVYLAVRSDAAFLAVGDGALEAVKQALKTEPKVGKPLQIEASVARFADVVSKDKPDAPKAAAKAFGKEKDSDRIRVSLEAGQELKVRFVMKTPVLTFFHLMEGTGEAAPK